jgi:hypothetical protein
MRAQQMISDAEETRALRDEVVLRAEDAHEAMEGLGFVKPVWAELQRRIGSGAAGQGGVRVTTTLDLDLQLQADCLARSQPACKATVASDASRRRWSPCRSLLLPLRPGDSGVDHGTPRRRGRARSFKGEVLARWAGPTRGWQPEPLWRP